MKSCKIAEVISNNDVRHGLLIIQWIIFKTRSLDLEQREALNTMLENDYGVDESAITSSNIGSTISGDAFTVFDCCYRSSILCSSLHLGSALKIYQWFASKVPSLPDP